MLHWWTPGLQNYLLGLVSCDQEYLDLGRWGRTIPGVFGLACQYMYWLCCIRPTAELPIPCLVLIFPSPPIGREYCPYPAQNSPYG